MMKSKRCMSAACAIAVLVVSGTVLAHHGTPAYENTLAEWKQATVTQFAWANPHSLIYFDVKNPQGEVVNWVAETAAPQALRLIGWSKASMAPGDVISVYMYAAKTGNPVGRLNHIILADGTRLDDTVLGGDRAPR